MSEQMRDPLAGKKMRVILQEANDRGEWLDVEMIPLVRRGPANAFSSGSLGWYGQHPSIDMGRPTRMNINCTETGTKGLGHAVVKGEASEEAKEARAKAKRQEAENFYTAGTAGRTRRTA